MAMGWWKPYFFLDPTGVQLLLPGLVIDGSLATLFLSGVAIALLSFLDRYTAHFSRNNQNASSYTLALCYTIQKFTSGLLMLVMMSFNALLFMEVVVFSGAAELWTKIRAQNSRQQNVEYQGVHTSEIEMDDC
mmetsp:Transcript_21458/g.53202  ORF Transcript_21458/g.53202 Transcript_21458/m.53202 type:complete len:133 (+) Transcript_21458:107-505(+)